MEIVLYFSIRCYKIQTRYIFHYIDWRPSAYTTERVYPVGSDTIYTLQTSHRDFVKQVGSLKPLQVAICYHLHQEWL